MPLITHSDKVADSGMVGGGLREEKKNRSKNVIGLKGSEGGRIAAVYSFCCLCRTHAPFFFNLCS